MSLAIRAGGDVLSLTVEAGQRCCGLQLGGREPHLHPPRQRSRQVTPHLGKNMPNMSRRSRARLGTLAGSLAAPSPSSRRLVMEGHQEGSVRHRRKVFARGPPPPPNPLKLPTSLNPLGSAPSPYTTCVSSPYVLNAMMNSCSISSLERGFSGGQHV